MKDQTTHASPTSIAYARALLELADERKVSPESVGAELNDLAGLIEKDPAFGKYLRDPSIGSDARANVLERAIKPSVSPLLYDFIRLLNNKGRLSTLTQLASAYSELLDERLGKVEVDLTVAHKLTPQELENAKKQISAALKRDAVVHAYVDENIIGGAVLRVGDKLIDASVKHQLRAMKEKLMARAPR